MIVAARSSHAALLRLILALLVAVVQTTLVLDVAAERRIGGGSTRANDDLAARVVMVRPDTTDGVLAEAYNRTRGELGMHGFDVITVAERDAAAITDLSQFAKAHRAFACIAFVQSGSSASVDLWLSERMDGNASHLTLASEAGADAPTLLALRTVELLRTSIEGSGPEGPSPGTGGDATPRRGPATARRSQRPTSAPPSTPWRLGAELVMALPLPAASPALGPSVSLGRMLRSRVGLALTLLGPLLGSELNAPNATASLRQELGLLEANFHLLRRSQLGIELLVMTGAAHLSASGSAAHPWRGASDAEWLGAAGAGVGASLAIAPGVSMTVHSRVLVFAPHVEVELAEAQRAIDAPLVLAGLGLETVF